MSAGIVIIGSGQAAGWAAKTLREGGYDRRISIVADEPWDFYERPPLSKSVLLDNDPSLTRLFSEVSQAALDLTWYRPLRAEMIARSEQRVMLSNGQTLPYDQLLIATGSRPRMPGREWQNHPRIHTLRSWQDALTLRAGLSDCRRLAVVGGGWIGLEIAASARQKGIDVTIFERQPALCQRSVDPGVSAALLALHQQHGVELHTGCGEIQLSYRQSLPQISSTRTAVQIFDRVVVGIGVELNLELALQAGLNVDNGIVVDGQGRTSDPLIFAAGDVARHPQLGISLQSWAFAQNQAIATARAMLDPQSPPYQAIPWLWSDQYDVNIQILGLPAETGTPVTRSQGDSTLWFRLGADCCLQQLVAFNDARSIKLAKRWMAAGTRLEAERLADPDFPLMSLR
ncbi:NAD(P)/FAD-dependent oxidoreductase [Erwinia persicina]|uniref:NAD(P)/FAD-dependent oxidoreductase n=1 Tax=Erwinia persicina TaxID=55211 RepID=UPI0017869D6D|nr:FAD-dependent oxidoreductase [Erwinia persicina]MBD8214721.1 FAD-dependent oxidoreductase [Erwinia persicina]